MGQAGTIRQALEQAKQQAETIPGGDLGIQDQEELIAILEKEVAKRHHAQASANSRDGENNHKEA